MALGGEKKEIQCTVLSGRKKSRGPDQIFGWEFDEIFGQGFDQGFGEGKDHKYGVWFYPA